MRYIIFCKTQILKITEVIFNSACAQFCDFCRVSCFNYFARVQVSSGWVLLTNKWVRLKWKWPKFREFLQPWRNYTRPMQRSTHFDASLQNRPVGKFTGIYLPSCHYYQLFSRQSGQSSNKIRPLRKKIFGSFRQMTFLI